MLNWRIELREIPEGSTLIGFWHTHTGFTDEMREFAENFSDPDAGFINWHETGMPLFLLTPNGTVKNWYRVR